MNRDLFDLGAALQLLSHFLPDRGVVIRTSGGSLHINMPANVADDLPEQISDLTDPVGFLVRDEEDGTVSFSLEME